ncbi:LamG domain-containing protein, partial [Candidatus Peregrinibacteria bacterium]|nr:LamG domain-containing protein [Candidatus Peregrinibacteria bacterium]MBT4585939.1 LamG domain-containing protein [Candidatus Peregrinibacteria bacterium]MBT6730503.1 LamG domain-containing protein [Candidatus Peregrinibacteria bacterium]MBT7344763.1 LamG domain-containing protein [Candidatus Peregrinibacteria bacterium]
ERRSEIAELQKALNQYQIKNGDFPETILPGYGNAYPICQYGQTDDSCLNIDAIVPDYVSEIPIDPLAEVGALHTWYEVFQASGQAFVVAPRLGETMPVDYIARWRFTETSMGTFEDTSGNGYTASCTSTCPSAAGVASPNDGYAIQFPNLDSKYISFEDPLLSATEFTICARVYKNEYRSGSSIISDYSSVTRNYILGYEAPEGTPGSRFYVGTNNGDDATSIYLNGLTLNNWHHVCGVYVGADYHKFFIDDNSIVDNLGSDHAVMPPTPTTERMGAYSSRTFRGLIDDIRMYDRALSDEEIALLRNEANPITE